MKKCRFTEPQIVSILKDAMRRSAPALPAHADRDRLPASVANPVPPRAGRGRPGHVQRQRTALLAEALCHHDLKCRRQSGHPDQSTGKAAAHGKRVRGIIVHRPPS